MFITYCFYLSIVLTNLLTMQNVKLKIMFKFFEEEKGLYKFGVVNTFFHLCDYNINFGNANEKCRIGLLSWSTTKKCYKNWLHIKQQSRFLIDRIIHTICIYKNIIDHNTVTLRSSNNLYAKGVTAHRLECVGKGSGNFGLLAC